MSRSYRTLQPLLVGVEDGKQGTGAGKCPGKECPERQWDLTGAGQVVR